MSIERNPSVGKPYIGPISDKLDRRSERYERWSDRLKKPFLGLIGISATSTVGAPSVLLLKGAGEWHAFAAFAAGLAVTTSIAVLVPILDEYVRTHILERLTPEELKLHEAELERFFKPPEEPGESFAIQKPKPPSLPPESAPVPSPIQPRPGGLSTTAEEETEKKLVLIK